MITPLPFEMLIFVLLIWPCLSKLFLDIKILKENHDTLSEVIHRLVINLFVVQPRLHESAYKAVNPADDPPKAL